jgi:hypothetical protein
VLDSDLGAGLEATTKSLDVVHAALYGESKYYSIFTVGLAATFSATFLGSN